MQLTNEQKAIIESNGNIKINAVAGSGKTTTLIEYAKSRPDNSKILYLAFNKSVKLEATKRFEAFGLTNVTVHTAHSLAYASVIRQFGYKLSNGYKPHDVVEILNLNTGSRLDNFIMADHVLKYVTYFCNSAVLKVGDLNYFQTISDDKALAFVESHHEEIFNNTRLFLAKMDKGEIAVIHDFYLKKFQLSNPKLNFDYILFDEAQDASGAMLDVFLKQNATKVVVGDSNQQIYGWRYAINSLDEVDFPEYYLTQSFRFDQSIADLAAEILSRKELIRQYITPKIAGIGKVKTNTNTQKATLARTNLGLLVEAIDFIETTSAKNKIYFEGDFNTYTYASEGASLYDILNLYNDEHDRILDKMIKSMQDFDELVEYVEKTDDKELAMMIDLVERYENDIFDLIKDIKERHVDVNKRSEAKMIFSTVHKSKGLEYDVIHLADDFLDEDTLKRKLSEEDLSPFLKNKLIEEVNLLYVAITRTKNQLTIPERLLPFGFVPSKNIRVKDALNDESSNKSICSKINGFERQFTHVTLPVEKPNYMAESKKKNPAAYAPWTAELDAELEKDFCEGMSVGELANKYQRTQGAIKARINKLELIEKYG